MSRKPGTLILLLANLAFAMPALAQIRDPETLPQAQSANAKSLVAKALTAVDAKQWPAAEAALKQLVSAEPRFEYARRSQIAARAEASLSHQPIPDAGP
jgi:outer membrane protein assembly factor BamD (BamD/ComL family)